MNSSLIISFIIFLFSISNVSSQPATPEELKKIDKIVQDMDNLWDKVATDFANKNGISRSELPKKLPTQFENEIRTQDRDTLYKVYNGTLNLNGKMEEAFLGYLEFSTKEGKLLVPSEVYNMDHENEPAFNPKHLKLLTLGQKLWEEFRLKFIKLNNLKPTALPEKVPNYYRVILSRLSDEELAQKEKEWDTRTKDHILEVFLQYAEFNYPNKGIKTRGEMSADNFLEGEKTSDRGGTDLIPAKIKVNEKPSFKEKYLKIFLLAAMAIVVAFFILKK
jgi:hypothetical protein